MSTYLEWSCRPDFVRSCDRNFQPKRGLIFIEMLTPTSNQNGIRIVTKLEPELLPKERLLDSLVTLLIDRSSKLCTGINKLDENKMIIAKVTRREVAPCMLCSQSLEV